MPLLGLERYDKNLKGDEMKTKKKTGKVLLIAVGILAAVLLIVLMGGSILIYESNFGERFETAQWLAYEPEDFEGLQMEQCYFPSNDGQMLAGYRYSKEDQEVKGLVVLAHGLGGGGHNTYMDVADYFTSNGYLVFAYDCTGNDLSEGDSVGGMPQGVIDLDYALRYVKTVPEYTDLDVVLWGHSWGAYSAGSVLQFHPDVKAVVMVAGMNRSEDLIGYQGQLMAGDAVEMVLPFMMAYEGLKFGDYASVSVMEGFEASDAAVMILHSRDDDTVPAEYGYDVFYEAYADDERFQFILFEDRGHNYLYNSEASEVYRDQINEDYAAYVESNGGEYNAEIKMEFMEQFLDKGEAFALDAELFSQILDFFDSYISKP